MQGAKAEAGAGRNSKFYAMKVETAACQDLEGRWGECALNRFGARTFMVQTMCAAFKLETVTISRAPAGTEV
jgi:hypothetical protein